jgi:hypothetical protein
MAKKMYYSEQEASQRLGIAVSELANLIRDDKLRVFQDGARRMFRVDDIEGLVSAAGPQGQPEIIDLSPTGGDSVSLAEAEPVAPASKEDTVITAEGISIFDDEDLEIEAADPMAKTQIAPSMEDQVALEGVGSGSGLLDLTRESDDTSLGAEVLDHIDLEAAPAGASGSSASVSSASMRSEMPTPTAAAGRESSESPMVGPTFVETTDPGAGLFGGLVIGAAVVAALIGLATLGYTSPLPLPYLAEIKSNLAIVLTVAVVVVALGGLLGWLAGKASTARQRALRQMGM